MPQVLITGGSGMVGTRLTECLLQSGMQVSHLSRNPNPYAPVKQFHWNYKTGIIDPEALQQSDAIINLAGAGIADHRWTTTYKKEIYNSRILGTRLLLQNLKHTKHKVKTIIQISATGIYLQNHAGTSDENMPLGNDFLAQTCINWEKELTNSVHPEIRSVILRSGIILSPGEGFLKQLERPIYYSGGVYFGSGTQYQSWIHINDLCAIIMRALTDSSIKGIYNAVSPNPIQQKQLMREIAHALHRRLWLPPVPAYVMRLLLGELAGELLASHALIPEHLLKSGFNFQFPILNPH